MTDRTEIVAKQLVTAGKFPRLLEGVQLEEDGRVNIERKSLAKLSKYVRDHIPQVIRTTVGGNDRTGFNVIENVVVIVTQKWKGVDKFMCMKEMRIFPGEMGMMSLLAGPMSDTLASQSKQPCQPIPSH